MEPIRKMMVEDTVHEYMKVVHVNWRLIPGSIVVSCGEEKTGCEPLDNLMAIPGIKGAFMKPYSITVEKGAMFEWEPILKEIEKKLGCLKKCST